MNPLLPFEEMIPDGEAHVMPDGRLYLYGSRDLPGNNDYCSDCYKVFSTGDPKPENWTDHGVSIERDERLYAPDCAYKNGRYVLFFTNDKGDVYTAVSDSPAGPFTDVRQIEGIHGIDPAVLVDDDGQGYLFWGQFDLSGAMLTDDLRQIRPETIRRHILTDERDGFHEGSSIRRVNGRYYLVFADLTRGRASSMGYAVSDRPLDGYVKRGTIIDNVCTDPAVWNVHGCIENYRGQWYVFYHRSSRNTQYNRRACCEKIQILPDGTIPEVVPTASGAAPLDPFAGIEACRAGRIRGGGYSGPDETGTETLLHARGSDYWPGWAEYKTLEMKKAAAGATVTARGKGHIAIRGENRVEYAAFDVDTPVYADFDVPCGIPAGTQVLYLFFSGNADADVRTIRLR